MLPSQKLVWDLSLIVSWFILGTGGFTALLSLVLTRNFRNPFFAEGLNMVFVGGCLVGLMMLLKYWGLNP